VYVTHDQVEAMTLGQRVAVMRDGRILQVDTPQRLYERPRDLFVAGFIGSPAMNLVDATIDGDEIAFGQFRAQLDPARRPEPGPPRRVVLGIRPESFEDAAFAPPDLPRIEVEVVVLEELGSDAHVFFHVDAPRIAPEVLEDEGEEDAQLVVEENALLNARVDPRTRGRVGGRLRLAVDPARFQFFEPETGASLLEDRGRRLEDAVPVAR
jgi:multiple sugar transport system ATP-binding protein